MFFGFHHDSNLCQCIVTGRIISDTRPKDDTFFIKSYQLCRVSIYVTLITVAYFDHKK